MQKDSEVSQTRRKVFPRERPPLVIEKITKTITVAEAASYSSASQKTARQTELSLPRVKWLERPDVA